MLRKDFIMVQIEQLGKMLAQLVTNRNNHTPDQNPALIETIYKSLKIEPDYLLTAPTEQIHEFLNQEDKGGLVRMEIAAKTLLETAYLEPEKRPVLQARAKELLAYVQAHDTTFSLERAALLADI